jgi:hypothetical protein
VTYLSDRQRIELHLPPMFLLGVVIAGVTDERHPDAVECRELLIAAAEAPFADLREPLRSKLIRRGHRTHEEVAGPYRKENSRVDKVGLIFYWLLKAITDCDYIVIGQDSALQKALDLVFPALEHAAVIDPLMASAQKQGRKVLEHLQRLGYYADVPYSS